MIETAVDLLAAGVGAIKRSSLHRIAAAMSVPQPLMSRRVQAVRAESHTSTERNRRILIVIRKRHNSEHFGNIPGRIHCLAERIPIRTLLDQSREIGTVC